MADFAPVLVLVLLTALAAAPSLRGLKPVRIPASILTARIRALLRLTRP
jgi:hypothetical protein